MRPVTAGAHICSPRADAHRAGEGEARGGQRGRKLRLAHGSWGPEGALRGEGGSERRAPG